MREQVFIHDNIRKWERAETAVHNSDWQSPDDLADVYVDVTSDLAFAQTHYPHSRITVYLNGLAGALHNEIYRNKREPLSRVLRFWTHEVPEVMWENRRLLLVSLTIFLVTAAIGVFSQMADTDFARLVLGDEYMDMTERNIMLGKPMDVYGDPDKGGMFFGITTNNIGVSFKMFVSGVLTSIATGFLLLQNGIMIGVFDAYFAQRGLLGLSLLTTMLHGTLELSAIIVAGAAGLALGNSWLFPGTYSRMESFRRGAKRGLKIVVGTVPVFIVAGFIESFITRHTEMPTAAKLLIIGLSALFVVSYFVVWPWMLHRRQAAMKQTEDGQAGEPMQHEAISADGALFGDHTNPLIP